MTHGFDVESLEQPYFVSRGQWYLTGNASVRAYELLARNTVFTSGAFGVSGLYHIRNVAKSYSDISGISGCIGVTLHALKEDSDTGMTNINQVSFRRAMGVLHMGMVKLPYVSGTLDGAVKTLTWGDRVAPSQSGFRVWQQINFTLISGDIGTDSLSGTFLHTGMAQQVLGTYADVPSNITGTTGEAWKRIFLNPYAINGVTK